MRQQLFTIHLMRILFIFALPLAGTNVFGQADSTKVKKKQKKEAPIQLYGSVADAFTKAAIPDVKVTLMREDSTTVDSTRVWESHSWSSGIGRSAGTTRYHFSISREPAKYILKMEHPNYETAYSPFEMKPVSRRQEDIQGPKVYLKKSARANNFEGGSLDEVVVKATKVKMVWHGDTLVFNADAFNVPEGSMLDALIKQLPGVELKDNGEIFVNGKKIDNLTLNGADFFKGKNKIMLQNLPYFTVKNIQVYKKQTEENKYLGIDDEDKKEFTMDVVLKREYSTGGSANAEAGHGTSQRYKLKAFGLRFSDRTRAVVFGGLNNINESMEYDAEDSQYNDKAQQSGDNHFKQVGGQFVYQAPEDKLTNATEVNATWSNQFDESRSQSETFLNGASTFGLSEGTSRSKTNSFTLKNTLRATGKMRFYSTAQIGYNGSQYESKGQSLTASAPLDSQTDTINSSYYQSSSKSNGLYANGYGYLAYRLPSGDSFTLSMQGYGNRSNNPETNSQNHYVYHKLHTHDDRDRRTLSPSYNYNLQADLAYNYQLTKSMRLSPTLGIGKSDYRSHRHEYLRDSVDYIFDTQNSYQQRTQTLNRRANLAIGYYTKLKKWYLNLNTSLSTNFQRQQMNYPSDPLNTSLTRHYTLFAPSVYFFLNSEDNKHDINAQYYIWTSTPSVTDFIDRPITSDPLNIFLGNPNLKPSQQHQWYANYRLRNDSIDQTIRLALDASTTHNARTQGYTYDTTTGSRTYRPENIGSGNWNLGVGINWSRALDHPKRWHIDNEINFRHTHSTSLALTTGSNDATRSRVGTSLVNYKPNIRVQTDKLLVNVKADIAYRHIHRNITIGQQPTDIWDIAYGLNANYKLPWQLNVDTDLTMHHRRGYTDHEMNDNRLYWDASLTKSFHQGQWLVKLRAYDLLGQVSNIHYNINAQGRTETWTNSMRRYALLTISYRFAQKPKKENK